MRFCTAAVAVCLLATMLPASCRARVFDGSPLTGAVIRNANRQVVGGNRRRRRPAEKADRRDFTPALRKQAAVPVAFALARHNASFAFLASCPGGDGSSVVVEWAIAGPYQGVSLLRVAHVSAQGATRTVAANVTLQDTPPSARCGAGGTVIAWTDQTAVGVDGLTGAVLFTAGSPSAVAVAGSAVYVAVPSGFMGPGVLSGYSLPSGAPLFAVNVSCTYSLVAQPASGTTMGAVWVGCLVNNGTLVHGASGAKIADTGSLLSSALAFAPTPSALVAVAFSGEGNPVGFGVSWATGAIVWKSADLASGNGNLLAAPGDVAAAVIQNTAPQPCQFVTVNASTGATLVVNNFTCDGQNGLDLGIVAGASTFVTVALMNAASTSFVVFDSAAAAPALLNVDAPSTQCPPAPANCPSLGQRVALCAPDAFAVGHGFPSTADGLVRPARIAFYARGSGSHLFDTAHVLAHAPIALACGGGKHEERTPAAAASLTVTSPEAIVALTLNGTVATAEVAESTSPATAATPLTLSQIGLLTRPVNDARSRFVGAALWTPSQPERSTTKLVTLALNGSSSILAAYGVRLGIPVTNDAAPLWQTPTCLPGGSQYIATLAVDDAAGVGWALCYENSTAVNLTTGRVVAVTPGHQEQYGANPAFLAGATLFTSRHWKVVQLSIRKPVVADGATVGYTVTTAVLAAVGNLRPAGLQAFPGSGAAVAYLQPADVGGLWSVSSSLVGVNLTSGATLWSWPSCTVVDMPCRSHEGGANTAQAVAVVIGSVTNVNPAPAVLGVDATTGDVAWSVSLADFIDPEASTSEGLPQHHSTCTNDGILLVTVAGAVLQIRTADGSVDWVRYDDRFFAPPTGTTFGASTATRVSAGSQAGVIVPILRGAWLLNASNGRTAARLSEAVVGRYEGVTSFGDVVGHRDVALSLGSAGVTLLNTASGRVISSVPLPASAGPLAWSSSTQPCDGSRATFSAASGGYGSLVAIFAVTEQSPAL